MYDVAVGAVAVGDVVTVVGTVAVCDVYDLGWVAGSTSAVVDVALCV